LDRSIYGLIVRHVPEIEVVEDRVGIDGSVDTCSHEGAWSRRKCQLVTDRRIRQRLHPQTVPHENHLSASVVPDSKREHPFQTGNQTIHTPVQITLKENLCICAALERRASTL
jgi:hypothetical protein